MSITHMAVVWKLPDPDLRDAKLLTLLALADFANDAGECWPGQPTLAQRARVSERHVARIIVWLEENGYVEVLVKGNGKGHSSRYRLLLKGDILTPNGVTKGDKLSSNPRKKDDKSSPNHRQYKKDDNLSPNAPPKDDKVSGFKGDIGSAKGDIGDTKGDIAMSTEPPLEPSLLQPPTDPPEREIVGASAPTPHDPAWDEFVRGICYFSYGHQAHETLTEPKRLALLKESKIIRDLGYTRDDVKQWWLRHGKQNLRWNDGKLRPQPHEIRELISQMRASNRPSEEDHLFNQPQAVTRIEPPRTDNPTWANILAAINVPQLADSQLVAAGERDGKPHYHVALADPRELGWVRNRAAPRIAKELGREVGQPVTVEIVAREELEQAP